MDSKAQCRMEMKIINKYRRNQLETAHSRPMLLVIKRGETFRNHADNLTQGSRHRLPHKAITRGGAGGITSRLEEHACGCAGTARLPAAPASSRMFLLGLPHIISRGNRFFALCRRCSRCVKSYRCQNHMSTVNGGEECVACSVLFFFCYLLIFFCCPWPWNVIVPRGVMFQKQKQERRLRLPCRYADGAKVRRSASPVVTRWDHRRSSHASSCFTFMKVSCGFVKFQVTQH